MKKTKLFIPALLAIISIGGLTSCSFGQNNDNEMTINEKKACASSSALSMVGKSNTVRSQKRLTSGDSSNPFSDLMSQFDTLFDAQENVDIVINENATGEFDYSADVSIGESEEFTYTLNYNVTVNENITTEVGELVINYTPLDFNFTLDFENIITYDVDNKNGSVNFKLYIDLLNEESKDSFVEVNEVLDLNNIEATTFNYRLVIANTEIMNYSIEIPYADENTLTITMNNTKFTVTRETSEGITTITISAYFGETELFSFTYERKEDENGNISYSLKSTNSFFN